MGSRPAAAAPPSPPGSPCPRGAGPGAGDPPAGPGKPLPPWLGRVRGGQSRPRDPARRPLGPAEDHGSRNPPEQGRHRPVPAAASGRSAQAQGPRSPAVTPGGAPLPGRSPPSPPHPTRSAAIRADVAAPQPLGHGGPGRGRRRSQVALRPASHGAASPRTRTPSALLAAQAAPFAKTLPYVARAAADAMPTPGEERQARPSLERAKPPLARKEAKNTTGKRSGRNCPQSNF